MKKGQAATELIILFSVGLAFLLIILSLQNDQFTSFSGQFEKTKGKTVVNDLGDAAEFVYRQGVGSKTKLFLTFPEQIASVSITGKTISMDIYAGGKLRTIYRTLDFDVSGSLPTDGGAQWVYVESGNNYVLIGVNASASTNQCGNNAIEGTETCDGSDLSPYSGNCSSYPGYVEGNLSCLGDCSGYELTECVTSWCGNNINEENETCDGTDLSPYTSSCGSYPGYVGGTLSCFANCSAFDFSLCTTTDTTPPHIELKTPTNVSDHTSNGTVEFSYNVTDPESNVENCSLFINTSRMRLNYSVTENFTSGFRYDRVANGIYLWLVNCTNNISLEGTSGTFKVNVSAPVDVIRGGDDNDVEWYDNENGWAANINDDVVSNIRGLGVGDIDGDLSNDIVISTTGDDIWLYLNDGGSWTQQEVRQNIGDDVESLVLIDVDSNGRQDIVAINEDGQDVLWFNNSGSYSSAWDQYTIKSNIGARVVEVKAADFDNDGDQDVAVSTQDIGSAGAVYWFENGNGWAQTLVGYSPNSNKDIEVMDLGDMNGDGRIDVVIGDDVDKIYWFNNTGSGWSTALTIDTSFSGKVRDLVIADMDSDNDLDVIVGTGSGSKQNQDGYIYLFNNRDGKGTSWNETRLDNGINGQARSVTAADLDADGDLEVIFGTGKNDVYYLDNDGSWSATGETTIHTDSGDNGVNINAIAVGNFD